ncbi:transmembrane protein 185A [Lingula anatina]|uniref:Transmembrane protein 185A n=1 Tax=Lingula anatina TaxID=7574 RepID=A0A1S3KGT5_LINAN|nr:transmembrane protein 185A [Lingula anatina]|eukprot:XP_013421441.1 transmembrane protein 185A [Lingula anatina]
MNLRHLFQDFNPSKFVVYSCLLLFSFLFALRLDGLIEWSYWVVFLPIWLWKILVLAGSCVGSYVWWKHPQYRIEGDSYVQYKAMIISTGMHLLLLMFELLVCDNLETSSQHHWILVFIPLIFMSIVSIGICVWAVKHERTFEMELFCAVNILQFIFLALRFDGFIMWNWVIVFIPLWILMCVAMIGVLYVIILAIILMKSPDIIPEQRRGNACSALGYTFLVIPMLIFLILLANKLEHPANYSYYVAVSLPFYIALLALIGMTFGAKGGNHWWFGIRKDFCQCVLGVCPLLQEYGNISYKIQKDDSEQNVTEPQENTEVKKPGSSNSKKTIEEPQRLTVPFISIEAPD